MNSMTGYGAGTCQLGGLTLAIEVHSVNQRGLMAQIYAPREWAGIDAEMQTVLREKFDRGKFTIHFRTHAATNDAGETQPDWEEVRKRLDWLREGARRFGTSDEISADLLYRMVAETGGEIPFPTWEKSREAVNRALKEALGQLARMRSEEGSRLLVDFRERLDTLHRLLEAIRKESTGRVAGYRDMLLARLQQLDLDLDPDDERVLKEIAFFADRCDISEEITRLQSHWDAFGEALDSGGSVGRKLEFILQEMHRELNTVGSKANAASLSGLVIEGKQELEKMREQAANVE